IAGEEPGTLAAVHRDKERGWRARQAGEIEKARGHFQDALRTAEQTSSRWQQQHICFLIGYLLIEEARYTDSDAWLRKAWRLRDPEHPTHLDAMIQENFGHSAQRQGDLHPALQHYHQALQLHGVIGYPEGVAAAANNLATLYQECGNPAAALVYYRQCLDTLEKDHHNAPTVENNIAECLLQLERPEEARFILEQSLGKGSAAYFQRLSLRQQYLRSANRSRQADRLASQALQEALATANAEFISDALCDALQAAPAGAAAERMVQDIAPKLPSADPNWWRIHYLLAQRYDGEGNLQAAKEHAWRAFSHLRRHKLGNDFEFNFSAAVLRVARLWISALVRQSKAREALTVWEMAKAFARGTPAAGLRRFQETLGPECAAIDFCVTPRRTIVWVVRRDTVVCLVLDLPEAALAGRLDSLLEPFVRPSNLLAPLYNRTLARELYRALIEPLQPALRGARCWTILPDGPLYALPFEMLEEDGGGHLLQRTTVRYWDTLRAPTDTARTLQEITAWVEEPFDDSSLLPDHTRVVRSWHDARGSRGDALHYAGHSLLDETFPALSSLAPGDAVTARQIARETLSYRLIVLSSCSSAGKIAGFGSGLLGLSAAFQSAGARQIIATLWPVDQHSSLLLREFYLLPLRESTLAENLRRARLAFRRKSYPVGAYSVPMSSPYFWAPYILIAPHYPHSRRPAQQTFLLALPLAAITTRCCIRRRSRRK
ncbi:MAG: CHAT domain-containing protein, partial [Acidobacteria bacterium]|nr:CHAT domain-containing protein [Acidobacteriota bacterium]